jgi:hypothetical protein
MSPEKDLAPAGGSKAMLSDRGQVAVLTWCGTARNEANTRRGRVDRPAIIGVVPHTAELAIPLNCPHCGGPIEVACEIGDDQAQHVRFVCPYCGEPRDFEAPGRVLWVAMRQMGDGPETRH